MRCVRATEDVGMKQALLVTTALITAAVIAARVEAAEPIRLTLGGYYETAAGVEVGGADGPGEPSHDRQTEAFKQYVQVWFKGATTLDNGLTVGTQIQLYGNNESNGNVIDQVWVFARGGFGDIRFGDQYEPLQIMCVPDPGQITHNFGLINKDSNSFTNVTTNAAATLQKIQTCQNSGQKGTKIVYYSPLFDGLQFGFDFQPNVNMSHGPVTGTATKSGAIRNLVAGEVNYDHELGPLTLRAGAGFEYAISPANPGPNPAFYQAGLQVGFGRWKVGASGDYWQNYGVSGRANAGSATPIDNGSDAWLATVGSSYAIDAWTLGLQYAHGEFETAKNATDRYNAVSLQAVYHLGPGIWLEGEAAYFWYNEDKVASSSTTLSATSRSASIGLGTYITY
jgi:outer membrane protein OmpU